MSAAARNVQAVFLAAAKISDPVARDQFVSDTCGDDAGLKARVKALLRALEQPDSLLDKPVVGAPDHDHAPTRDHASNDASPGEAASRNHGVTLSDLSFLFPTQRPDSLGRIGHYEVLEVLGRGGFGIVFRAIDDVLQRVVAVKVLAPELAATSPARKRFLREARSSAAVRHENVVQVHEVGEQPLPYLVMEFIPGETLQQRLDRTGPLDLPEILSIGRQVADGLAAAHAQDLVHRDIKPSNILIEAGSHGRAKLTDFGLARAADDASISQSGVVAGTPMYMAPEQAKGASLDHRADLFSLGSVLYTTIAGHPPFRANSTLAVLKRVVEETPRPLTEIIPETPDWLCRIVAKLHAKDPGERYQSAREVGAVLADCEQRVKAHGSPQNDSLIPVRNPLRKREIKWWAWAAGLALVLTVFFLSNRPRGHDAAPGGEPTQREASLLEILPEQGLASVIVLRNDEGVIDGDKLHTQMTDWLDMRKRQTLKLKPGMYQLNVATYPMGTVVSRWEVTTSNRFGSERVWVPVQNSSAIITVEPGSQTTLRPVMMMPQPDSPTK